VRIDVDRLPWFFCDAHFARKVVLALYLFSRVSITPIRSCLSSARSTHLDLSPLYQRLLGVVGVHEFHDDIGPVWSLHLEFA
jgi:hypothetical protein